MRALMLLAGSLLVSVFGIFAAPRDLPWHRDPGPRVAAHADFPGGHARVLVRDRDDRFAFRRHDDDDDDIPSFFFSFGGPPVVVAEPAYYAPVYYASVPPGRPPGWDRGRKVGWGGCDLPPGLAKKYGCYGSGYAFRERPADSTVIFFSVH